MKLKHPNFSVELILQKMTMIKMMEIFGNPRNKEIKSNNRSRILCLINSINKDTKTSKIYSEKRKLIVYKL